MAKAHRASSLENHLASTIEGLGNSPFLPDNVCDSIDNSC